MDVFSALADPVRRGLLEQLARDGAVRVVDLTVGRGISRPAVSRHLRVLGEAGLVRARDHGRERHYELVAGPLDEVVSWAHRVAAPPPRPPLADHQLDALDLEVRRTVRERAAHETSSSARHTDGSPVTADPPTTAGESA